MPNDESLRTYGAHRKALELFDLVVADVSSLAREPALQRLVSQQFASADSVASNIEEGFGRGSCADYSRFLLIARGSAQETAGRYGRFKHWLPEPVVTARVTLCGEIIAILTASIRTLRTKPSEQ
ncbi:MAG: four helix bundle protein [Opitutus sp.]|nr:four helix bundle protein [Opitutus sp.]